MARPPLRTLVIGAGPAANDLHFPVLAALRDQGLIELSCICDLERERAANARRRFRFLDETGDASGALVRGDIDAVYIFAAAQVHRDYGLRALRQGKHLFVEKPIAPSYADACEMAAAAAQHSVIAVGGHNRRFYGALTAIRARAGAAGWRFAEVTFHKNEFGKRPSFGARSWLTANGIHALDALVDMMGGLPHSIAAVASDAENGVPSAFSAVMQWDDGAQATFLCNNQAGARREEYVFHAAGETCRVLQGVLTVQTAGRETRKEFPERNDGIEAEHREFLAAIASGEQPRHAIETLAPSLYLAELIEDGYRGEVCLPLRARPAKRRQHHDGAILVAGANSVMAPLARLLPGRSLVSLDDVTSPRADIVAAVLGRGAVPLREDVLDKLPNLKIAGVLGLSVSRFGADALLARDILLVNASATYAASVAEFALGLAILARRRAFTSHDIMRAGGWGTSSGGPASALRNAYKRLRPRLNRMGLDPIIRKAWGQTKPILGIAPAIPGHELRGGVAGLIGWSANARAFTRHLLACGASVRVFSEHATPHDIESAGAVPASLSEVLSADIVSLHRGLTKATHHFLGAAELERLRPGTVFINLARGALVDPEALVQRLKRGDVFACLDTFEEEPLPASHVLRRLPNVFLTSHIAAGSADMMEAAAEEVIGKIARHLDGQGTEPVSAERLRTMT